MTPSTSTKTTTTTTTTPAPLPLTAGIEIEHILAIHRHRNRLDGTTNDPFDTTSYDPLKYLQAQFATHRLDSFVSNAAKGIEFDYRTWLITTDGSLDSYIPCDEIRAALPSKIRVEEQGEWSENSVELVSPPLAAPDARSPIPAVQQQGLRDLKSYLDVMHGSRNHGVFVTPQCGLHVHIGLAPDEKHPSGRDIPLPVLQHLAYLLLKYETVINSLHHHSRTPLPGTQAATYARSNRISFLASRHSEACDRNSSRLDLAEVRRRVFQEGMSVRWLAWMMGAEEMLDSKGKSVSFQESEPRVSNWDDQVSAEGALVARAPAVAPWGQAPEPSTAGGEAAGGNGSGQVGDLSLVESAVIESEVNARTTANTVIPPHSTTNNTTYSSSSSGAPSEIFATSSEGGETLATSIIRPPPTTTVPHPAAENPQHFPAGNKYKVSRWDLLPNHPSDGPRTIEFRQAAGSVDANEIAETVSLYIAIVRCAERRANLDVAAGNAVGRCVDSSSESSSDVTLSSFLHLLQLPENVRAYWTSRASLLQESAVLALRDPTTMRSRQKCPVCAARHTKRQETRHTNSKRTKGWLAFLPGASRSKARETWSRCTVKGKWEGTPKPWGRRTVEETNSWIAKNHTEERNWEGKPVRRFGGKRKGRGKKQAFTRKVKCEAKKKARAKTRRRAKKHKEEELAAARLKQPGVPDWDLVNNNEQVAQWRDGVETASGERIVVAELVSEPHDPNYAPVGGW